MSRDELLGAVRVLIGLEGPRAAAEAAVLLPAHLQVADLLRAADGVQQLARALDTHRALDRDHRRTEMGHDVPEIGHEQPSNHPTGRREASVGAASPRRARPSVYR